MHHTKQYQVLTQPYTFAPAGPTHQPGGAKFISKYLKTNCFPDINHSDDCGPSLSIGQTWTLILSGASGGSPLTGWVGGAFGGPKPVPSATHRSGVQSLLVPREVALRSARARLPLRRRCEVAKRYQMRSTPCQASPAYRRSGHRPPVQSATSALVAAPLPPGAEPTATQIVLFLNNRGSNTDRNLSMGRISLKNHKN